MSAQRPVITDLIEALETQDRLEENNTSHISPEILKMFHSEDAREGTTKKDAVVRFNEARTLFQTVRDRGASEAIFYKLHDKRPIEAAYNRNRLYIKDQFIAQFGVTRPSWEEKVAFFLALRTQLRSINPRTEDQEIQLKLAKLWAACHRLNSLASVTQKAEEWFEAEKGVAESLAAKAYFGRFGVNPGNAKEIGKIYNPRKHNWGTNVAWVLSVTRRGLPIHVFSPLTDENTKRRSRDPAPPRPMPSAFALEMSIAIMMDYKLEFAPDGSLTLRPPDVLPLSNTTGVIGDGILPTADQQMAIYGACVLERFRLDHRIDGWPPDAYKGWRTALTNAPLDNKATFDNLRAELRAFHLMAIENDLKTKCTIGDYQSLRDEITRIYILGDDDDKRNLADALGLMQVAGQLTIILDKLTIAEHDNLTTLLCNAPFQEVEAYDNLRTVVESARINKQAANELEILCRQAPEDLRTVVSASCNGEEALKMSLADTLALMQRNNELGPILVALAPTGLSELNTMLNNAPCQGSETYDDLRTTVGAARQAAEARPRSNSLPMLTAATYDSLRVRGRSASLPDSQVHNQENPDNLGF